MDVSDPADLHPALIQAAACTVRLQPSICCQNNAKDNVTALS
jgi:hypothetical protein